MSESTIILKPINALLTDEQGEPARYWIPAYQRGYRWSEVEVTQLLEDIWEFTETIAERSKKEFYCLQPLVLSPKADGRLEVVDGQQRLTTILLILSFLNQRFSVDFQKRLYSIEFETRHAFDEFLKLPTEEAANLNVDFFHLYKAIETIRKWFAGKSNFVNDIESALLNRVKVIWFQLAEGDNPVDAFTRLNVGKIPLTDDELIRALFLKRGNGDDSEEEAQKLRIAYEWDLLEKALQADPFWYFLNRPGRSRNRISFLFELSVREAGFQESKGPYGIFYAFNDKLSRPGADREEEWRRIKQIFMMLEEWYDDRKLFHIVGFLVNEGHSILEIRELANGCTKGAFVEALKRRIYRVVIGAEPPENMDEGTAREAVQNLLEDLDYEIQSKRPRIRSVLLLFNMASLLIDSRSNIRFQFDSFKSLRWDLEHIRSIASDRPKSAADRRQWMQDCLDFFGTQEDRNELKAATAQHLDRNPSEITDEEFEKLDAKLLEVFKESVDSDAEHGIGNLTLLDQGTNRGYKNAVFAIKRERLLATDRAGIFVPLCTRNAFLKAYTKKTENPMFWSEEDRASYQNEILETLVGFFIGRKEMTS
jgi:hypothetical protein